MDKHILQTILKDKFSFEISLTEWNTIITNFKHNYVFFIFIHLFLKRNTYRKLPPINHQKRNNKFKNSLGLKKIILK